MIRVIDGHGQARCRSVSIEPSRQTGRDGLSCGRQTVYTVYTGTILQSIHHDVWLLLLVLVTITIESSESTWTRGSSIAVLANLRRCLTSINVRMVSGFKLARRREMVSRPPEKIRSTATAGFLEFNLSLSSFTCESRH
jgi:hypothetical protein